MILPPGTKLRLEPRDEYTHTPEPVSNYNESMYLTAFDTRQGLGTWMRLGNRPNEGHAEMSFCAYLPSGKVAFMYARPKIDHNRAMNAGGMHIEVLEPFKHLRVRFEGEVLLMKNPHDLSNPGAAFKTNPKVAAAMDLALQGVSPMYGGEIVNEDGSPIQLDPERATLRGHTEQHMAVIGRMRVGDEEFEVTDGTGYRDKSWGPRHWRNFFWHRFMPITFSADFGVLLVIQGRPDGEPVISGHVYRNGRLEPLAGATLRARWDEGFLPRAFVATLRTEQGEFELHGLVRSLVPLRHKALPGTDPNTHTRIIEAMTEYRCEGHSVLAMAEFCDTLTDGVPVTCQEGTGYS